MSGGPAAVVFDCDGTLVDSEPLARRAWERSLAPYGYAIDDAEYGRLIGLPYQRVHAFFAGQIPGLEPAAPFWERLLRDAVRADRRPSSSRSPTRWRRSAGAARARRRAGGRLVVPARPAGPHAGPHRAGGRVRGDRRGRRGRPRQAGAGHVPRGRRGARRRAGRLHRDRGLRRRASPRRSRPGCATSASRATARTARRRRRGARRAQRGRGARRRRASSARRRRPRRRRTRSPRRPRPRRRRSAPPGPSPARRAPPPAARRRAPGAP